MPNNAFRFKYELNMEAGESTAEVLLYGEITSYKWSEDDPAVTAREFDKMLKQAKENGKTKLKLRINSPGGSVWQAVAMRTMLMTSDFEEIDVRIEGLCASAATLFACIPNAHVSIAEGSEFMIHNPFTAMCGNADEMEKAAERLRKIEQEDHAMYAQRTGQSEEQIKEWMDAETWFTAREAVQYGFCDELIDAGTIAAKVDHETMQCMKGMYRSVPDNVTEEAAQTKVTYEPTEVAAGGASEINQSEQEEKNMEIKDITMEQIKAENHDLYASIIAAGAVAERERISEIDDLTPAGYEELAQKAKADGTDTASYIKMLVKAQREKGANYLAARKEETEPAQKVAGESTEDHDATEADAMDAFAKEMGEMAKSNRYDMGVNMF